MIKYMKLEISPSIGYEPYVDRQKIYLFSNEAQKEVLEGVSHNASRILTILGGGDYVIGAFANGASSVVGIDLNMYANYFSQLKVASVRKLDYEDFLVFWKKEKGGFVNDNKIRGSLKAQFSMDTYDFLRGEIKSGARNFFDELFQWSYQSTRGPVPVANDLFYGDIDPEEFAFIPYLSSKKEYLKAQKKLNELRELPLQTKVDSICSVSLEDEFDIINLSNMIDLRTDISELEKMLEKFRNVIRTNGSVFAWTYENLEDLPLIEGFSTRVLGASSQIQQQYSDELILRYCYVFTKQD